MSLKLKSGFLGDFFYLHGQNQSILNAINMLGHSVCQQGTRQVTNNLMDLDYNRASWIGMEAPGLNHRIDLFPLPLPILADGLLSVDPAAFHAVGPIDLGVHSGQNSIDVTVIKCCVYCAK